MKSFVKSILSLFLSLMIIFSATALSGVCSFAASTNDEAEEFTENLTTAIVSDNALAEMGKCGINVFWGFDKSSGELRISGEGDMFDYDDLSGFYSPFILNESIKSVIIEPGVTSVGSQSFYGCTGLTSVMIPIGVTKISYGAFSGCSSLADIVIPDSVTEIGWSAFSRCNSLNSIEIPGGVDYIGMFAFTDCSSLENVNLGNGITAIGMDAFSGCSSLTSIDIPDSVTEIHDAAFSHCSSLKNARIGRSVELILDYVFYGCSNLTSISVDSKNSHYSSDSNGILYNKGKTELVQYPNGRKNTSFTIPNNVTSIHRVAFADSDYLESVIIPDSVKTIGDAAFESCEGLVSIKIPKSVTEISEHVFSYCKNLISVEISEGVKSIEWSAFSYCSSLKRITIPKSVTSIDDKAFDETYNFYIRCYKNSYAHRYAIDNEIPVRFIGTSVISVEVNDLTLQYRSSATLSPLIEADSGASYTVTYTSSNPSVATIDYNSGKVTSVKQSGLNRGSTVITCTVTDSYGNTVTDTCTVTVQFAWWQWIIKIVLLGWGWY